MVLTAEQIRAITLGVDRVIEEDNGVFFYRFTEEQIAFYKDRKADSYLRTFDPAGVKLRFRTDSRTLYLNVLTEEGSSRSYFSVEVFVNGKRLDSLNNFEGVVLPEMYTTAKLPLGEFEKDFDLGNGEKEVCIYLPWSVKTWIREMRLDGGAFVEPVKPKRTLLAFGDSITQGYDALYPSNMYITQLSEHLDVELVNKAIGGEVFAPQFPLMKERFTPDIITVAYGTNDWNRYTKEVYIENCKGFFENLCTSYPTAKIVVITPIWRRDGVEKRAFGAFEEVDTIIRSCVPARENITILNGYEFVPHDSVMYADFRLHPNDKGFKHYYEALVKAWE